MSIFVSALLIGGAVIMLVSYLVGIKHENLRGVTNYTIWIGLTLILVAYFNLKDVLH